MQANALTRLALYFIVAAISAFVNPSIQNSAVSCQDKTTVLHSFLAPRQNFIFYGLFICTWPDRSCSAVLSIPAVGIKHSAIVCCVICFDGITFSGAYPARDYNLAEIGKLVRAGRKQQDFIFGIKTHARVVNRMNSKLIDKIQIIVVIFKACFHVVEWLTLLRQGIGDKYREDFPLRLVINGVRYKSWSGFIKIERLIIFQLGEHVSTKAVIKTPHFICLYAFIHTDHCAYSIVICFNRVHLL